MNNKIAKFQSLIDSSNSIVFHGEPGQRFMSENATSKHIVAILRGSPRKAGNTNALTCIVTDMLAQAGVSLFSHDLYDMDIRPCLACRHCQKNYAEPNCVQKDDMNIIFENVLKSELIILATPVHSWYCTAPMKAALDRMVYALNKYYGGEKGPSLWAGRNVALITTCGYRPEKGADLFAEGIKRYCKHSGLNYLDMLCERHANLETPFMDDEKEAHARDFADRLILHLREKILCG